MEKKVEELEFKLPDDLLKFTAINEEGKEVIYTSLSYTAQMSWNRISNIYKLGISDILPSIINQLNSNSFNEIIDSLKITSQIDNLKTVKISENSVLKSLIETIYQLVTSDTLQFILAFLFYKETENEFYFKRENLITSDRLAEVLQCPRDLAIEVVMRFFYLTLSQDIVNSSPTHTLTKQLLKRFLKVKVK
ncbi:MAG: hypothetical protein IPM06_22340 [Rhizobiales bacterium]|nr:hypothetical protein [Hyphomicrobiales bacterium]